MHQLLKFAAIKASLLLACMLCVALSAARASDAAKVAARADAMLAKELAESTSASVVDDATFLRRAALDLTGEIPTPAELTSFALDPSPGKRAAAVERLLADNNFGQNWARYWRDVILYRRSDERALLVGPALTASLTQKFNAGAKWDQVAREFITAKGDARDEGSVAIIMAQMADPANTTAEISRIFLGVQIQCAQCHNHPTDRWKREQFHELAAFFPRIGVRPVRTDTRRSFEVVSFDRPAGRRAPGATEPTTLEYYMPDLEDPQAKGKLMTPKFFATGQKLPLGLTDAQRRAKLAEWITARGDGWFAKAYVNRMWGELVGAGFYEPIDDLGPDRKPTAPQTLALLATEFTSSGYDVKWLFRAITSTAAYQREGRSHADNQAGQLLANCPQRLRADQLFNSLSNVLGIEDTPARPGARPGEPRGGQDSPRGKLNQVFGYDPSQRHEEVGGSIPQALLLMNSPEVNRPIQGQRPDTSLGQLLAEVRDDEAVTVELYLRCLAREPKPSELATCLEHVKSTDGRAAGFEDILWSLVNSTEFLHRK